MTAVLASATIALGIARLAMFIALHLVPNEYSPIRHAVSDYAVGRTRALSSVMTWTTGAMWLALAGTLLTGLPTWSDLTGVTVCILALAVIFIVLPFLPTDLEGQKTTTIGRLHLLAAIAWFALSYACMGNLTRLLTPLAPAALGATLSVVSTITLVALIALVAALVIQPLRQHVFGLSERVFILGVTIFYVAAAFGILLVA
ncbi:DUF998 domain-containing protein [Microbacterium sp. MPKO10]|uniref:DUF998 domain-containing protein n=1 Tax=Microbacterium sp. MPKO10 TaxID=2989818 RepID=UPI002235AFCF|nr:DUF998 domain-containing protein [Microbacterium sp. MPKO10]MCW4456789.1 DUF998 domain-containing protein [Microbacterium sp. MPKO10]